MSDEETAAAGETEQLNDAGDLVEASCVAPAYEAGKGPYAHLGEEGEQP